MKNSCMVLFLLFLGACNNGEKKVSGPSAQNDSASKSNSGQSTVNTSPVFSLGSFDKTNTPLKDSVKGNIIDGTSWIDAEG